MSAWVNVVVGRIFVYYNRYKRWSMIACVILTKYSPGMFVCTKLKQTLSYHQVKVLCVCAVSCNSPLDGAKFSTQDLYEKCNNYAKMHSFANSNKQGYLRHKTQFAPRLHAFSFLHIVCWYGPLSSCWVFCFVPVWILEEKQHTNIKILLPRL